MASSGHVAFYPAFAHDEQRGAYENRKHVRLNNAQLKFLSHTNTCHISHINQFLAHVNDINILSSV